MFESNAKAFTIIELLVVIAVISVLAAIVLANINQYAEKSRNTRRKVDLVNIKKALMMYAIDHNNTLPASGFGWSDGGQGWATNNNAGAPCYGGGDLEDFLDGTDANIPDPKNFYVKMPHDPKCGGCGGCGSNPGGYMYYHSGSSCAVVFAGLENPTAADLSSCTGVCVGLPGYGMNYCIEIKL